MIHAAFFYVQVGINYKIIGSIPILLVWKKCFCTKYVQKYAMATCWKFENLNSAGGKNHR